MADNVTLDAGSGGAVVAADDVSSVFYQRVKLDGGGDGASTPILAGGGVEASAIRVTIASDSTGVLSVDDNGAALTVDNGGTFAVQVDGDALTALQLIDNIVQAEDAVHGTGDSGVMALAVRNDTLAALAGTDGDYAPLQVNATGALYVSVDGTATVSGTVTANLSATDNAVLDQIEVNTSYGDNTGGGTESGVLRVTIANDSTGVLSIDDGGGNISIDDGGNAITVDNGGTFAVQSTLQTGSNVVGQVGLEPRTSGGNSFHKTIDLDETEEEVKGSAGQLYSVFFTNTNASVRFLKIYNATAASVTVGTTVPDITLQIPPDNGGLHIKWVHGLAFGTAITVAATTGVADNDSGAPGANEIVGVVEYQ